jgi:hypothetical protein
MKRSKALEVPLFCLCFIVLIAVPCSTTNEIFGKEENNTKTAKNYKPESSPYASTVQKLFEGVQSITAKSSHPRDVAEVVLKVVNTSNPNVRCPVGKDAESVLKKRAELLDMEMEKWVRESFLEKKGFIR